MTAPAVVVRRVTDPQDGRLVRDVRLAALRSDPAAFYSSHADEAGLPDEHWCAWAASGSFRVARDDASGTVLGCLGTVEERGAPPGGLHLVSMWVDPAARGRGVARRLVEAVADDARAGGRVRLTLWVVLTNAAARGTYRRLGFREEDPPPGVRDYRPEGEVRMVRDLA